MSKSKYAYDVDSTNPRVARPNGDAWNIEFPAAQFATEQEALIEFGDSEGKRAWENQNLFFDNYDNRVQGEIFMRFAPNSFRRR